LDEPREPRRVSRRVLALLIKSFTRVYNNTQNVCFRCCASVVNQTVFRYTNLVLYYILYTNDVFRVKNSNVSWNDRVRAVADVRRGWKQVEVRKNFSHYFFIRRKPKGLERLFSSLHHAIIKYTRIACTLYISIYLLLQNRDTIPS